MSQARFSGKVAVVTGAGSGIGRATALAFAREGADVAICDVNEETLAAASSEIRGLGRRAFSRKVDVSSEAAMAGFAGAVHDELGAVDVLVNNAGVALSGGMLETTIEDWSWIFGINVMGVVHGCHHFVPRMVERGRGHVVNIASAAGLAGSRMLVAYCTTKFAVVGFSESLRAELAPKGIGVTAICPGFIKTNITESGRRRGVFAKPEMIEKARKVMDRGVSPDRVAERIMHAVENDIGLLPVTAEAWLIHGLKRASPSALSRLWRGIEDWQAPRD